MSWEHWNAGLIPGPAQRVKDLVLLELRLSSQLWLGSDPWPRNSMCHGAAKKKKTSKTKLELLKSSYSNLISRFNHLRTKLTCILTSTKYLPSIKHVKELNEPFTPILGAEY